MVEIGLKSRKNGENPVKISKKTEKKGLKSRENSENPGKW